MWELATKEKKFQKGSSANPESISELWVDLRQDESAFPVSEQLIWGGSIDCEEVHSELKRVHDDYDYDSPRQHTYWLTNSLRACCK